MADNTVFTGTSRFTNDFGQVLERSVRIASLALTQMTQGKTRLDDEVTALTNLDNVVAKLGSGITAIQDSLGFGGFATTVSDTAVVKAAASDGVLPGTYSLKVTSLGSYTTVSTKDTVAGVSDPAVGNISTSSSFTLIIDDKEDSLDPEQITISPGASNLRSLVDAINTAAGSKVQATIVNAGTSSAPQYVLSLQSTKLGKIALQLKDQGGVSLMDMDETVSNDPKLGARATYELNGLPVSSDSRSVTIAPSLKADLLDESATPVTITVGRSTSSFRNAVNTFINAYNAVIAEIDGHKTAQNSALRGSSVLGLVTATLRNMANAAGTGRFQSLDSIGIAFDKNGKLYLDSAVFDSVVTAENMDDLEELFGTTTTSGVLKTADELLDSLTDSTNGLLKSYINTTKDAAEAQQERINAEQARVEQITRDLQERLAEADATIAMLEQQASYFNDLFKAMKANSEAYR